MASTTQPGETEKDKDARRLRELFHGRFSHEVAKKILTDFDGLAQAADFLMNEQSAVVQRYLQKEPLYMEQLRNDSEQIHKSLNQGIEAEVRLFACKDCNSYWWRKVPARKEVSKCRLCHMKYDPIPRYNEWGSRGLYKCDCGNIFHGFGEMGVTVKPCLTCGYGTVPVYLIEPPSKDDKKIVRRRRSSDSSTNQVQLYNQRGGWGQPFNPMAVPPFNPNVQGSHSFGMTYANFGAIKSQGNTYNISNNQTTDAHFYARPRSQGGSLESLNYRSRVLTASKKHASSGSTVTTNLSQIDLKTEYSTPCYTLESISESDDGEP